MCFRLSIIFLILSILGCSTVLRENQDNFVCINAGSGLHCMECSLKSLSSDQHQKFKDYLGWSVEHIMQNINAPQKDGYKYNGRIVFNINNLGVIDKVVIAKRSGHDGLDNAMMKAVFKTKQILVPTDVCLAHLFYKRLFHLTYDETDMAE